MLYQVLTFFIAIIAILLVFNIYHNRKASIQTFILWVLLWLLLAIFAIIPESITFLANFIGINRGMDLLIIFGLIFLYYLVFRLYLKIEKANNDITELVRRIAIDKEIDVDDDLNDD